ETGLAWLIIRPSGQAELAVAGGHFLLVLAGYLVRRNTPTGHVRYAGAHVFAVLRSPLVCDREHAGRKRRIDVVRAHATEDADRPPARGKTLSRGDSPCGRAVRRGRRDGRNRSGR